MQRQAIDWGILFHQPLSAMLSNSRIESDFRCRFVADTVGAPFRYVSRFPRNRKRGQKLPAALSRAVFAYFDAMNAR
jgi:hypothetical protein